MCSLHLAVNACINCSFVHLYLQFYYSLNNISYFGLYSSTCVLKLQRDCGHDFDLSGHVTSSVM